MHAWMDGWMDGYVDTYIYIYVCVYIYICIHTGKSDIFCIEELRNQHALFPARCSLHIHS